MRENQSDFVIIGGGIIGLSMAVELAEQGASVAIFDQGDFGGEASVAAAGMLAPLKEFMEAGPLLNLGIKSLEMYRSWTAKLEQHTGINAQMSSNGVLTIALDRVEVEWLLSRYEWQKRAGYDVHLLDEHELHEAEPALTKEAKLAIWSPQEADVNNQLLLRSLVRRCMQLGVFMYKNTMITNVIKESATRVSGVDTTAGKWRANHVVVTAGAWSSILLRDVGIETSVHPVRGQIAAVSSELVSIRHVIFGKKGYLVPKQDDRIIIGATEDFAGYERAVTVDGVASVLHGATTLIPATQQARFLTAWAGLRPATLDGLPLLGPVPNWQGLSIATGHYRNGILLAPITAYVMGEWLLHGKREPLEPFLPERLRSLPV
ncbi:glycine oxidase ThiO [Brevibacillus daliensis]|uniref:glycine oxidase ThiO n=1 Tax=Brevibacillus daliensis TaxID=2892995 RepID=UPI001E3FCC14|nr:glycine oxidase ThiO [Brevibacillus daliensis]